MPEYYDETGRKYWTHVLYVVELDPAACSAPGSPCPRAPCDRVPVYVGIPARRLRSGSSSTSEERTRERDGLSDTA
jgi:hypothetical protein